MITPAISIKTPIYLHLIGIILIVLLNACSLSSNIKQEPDTHSASLSQEETDAQPAVEYAKFEPETLYALLVAEFAGGRNRFDIMLSNYTQQAQTTLDPGVIARASRLARYINAVKPSVDMSELWTQVEPDNNEAHLNATAALISDKQYIEALKHAKVLLSRGGINGLDTLGANAARGPVEEVKALSVEYRSLINQYPDMAEIHLGFCYLQHRLKQLDEALKSCQRAIALSEYTLPARAQEARIILQKGDIKTAVSRYEKLTEDYPDNTRVQLQYARALSRIDIAASAEQFESLHEKLPTDVDITLALGLVHYQQGNFEQSKPAFKKLISNTRHTSLANYYLGQIAIEQRKDEAAISYLSAVEPGNEYMKALGQIVQLYAAMGNETQALAFINERRKDFDERLKENSYLLESQIYSGQGNYAQAVTVLNSGLGTFGGSVKLLYARAMLYTEINDIQQAEIDLKQVLAVTPDNAAALNALGYTLADRTNRLDEAYSYIKRAYNISPDSAAVIDSLGWVLYRKGKFSEALGYLRQAYEKLPDQEIAAHLGEVLWVTGNKQEARNVFRDMLKTQPNSPLIKKTLERLEIDL